MKHHSPPQPCALGHVIESCCCVTPVPQLAVVIHPVATREDSPGQRALRCVPALLLHSELDVEEVRSDQQEDWGQWETVLISAK